MLSKCPRFKLQSNQIASDTKGARDNEYAIIFHKLDSRISPRNVVEVSKMILLWERKLTR